MSAFSPLSIFIPTFKPFGAIIYLFSPSAYLIKAILDDLFGSYSIEATVPSTLSLSLLKSMIRYFLFAPPPRCLTVIRPELLRPPFFLRVTSNDFSGVVEVISSFVNVDLPRWPFVIALYVLIAIISLLLD